MTNGIHFRVVVKSTCLNNMYHYRYQERTPNTSIGNIRNHLSAYSSVAQFDLSMLWW